MVKDNKKGVKKSTILILTIVVLLLVASVLAVHFLNSESKTEEKIPNNVGSVGLYVEGGSDIEVNNGQG